MSEQTTLKENQAETEAQDGRELTEKYTLDKNHAFAFFEDREKAIDEAENWMRSAKEVCFEYKDDFREKYQVKIDRVSFKESLEAVEEWKAFKED